jgi:hypothetical protein
MAVAVQDCMRWIFTSYVFLWVLILPACASVLSPLADEPAPDAGSASRSSAAFAPAWTMQSPDGMQQLPEEDVAIAGPLRFGLRGFDQVARASDGTSELRVVPRRAGRAPMRLLLEPTGTRSLVWMLTPIGLLWHNAIVWDDGKADEGRLLYHVLEGGVLSATWTRQSVGTSLTVELSSVPTVIAGGVYQLGALRVRVVNGSAELVDHVLVVTPNGERTQLLVYSDPLLDTTAVNAAGALVTPAPGHVAEQPGPVAEKHVVFDSPILELRRVLALGATPSVLPGPVLLADRAELFVGDPSSTTGWRISALAAKIIKSGVIGMRRMRYAHATAIAGASVGGQTFNFYVFSPRGTATLWSVGRVTEPYRLSLFAAREKSSPVVLAEFPATENDYSEDLATGRDVMHTRTAWAWDDSTLVEAAALEARVPLAHTGREGNSVDGGWRHVVTGPLQQFTVGDAAQFAATAVPTGSYRYDLGTAFHATYAGLSVFHHQRAWSGVWAERADRVASIRVADTIYAGAMKDLHDTDVLPAGGKLVVSQVLHVSTEQEDPAVLRARFALAPGTALAGGMLDLGKGARPVAPWDLAVEGDLVGIAYGAQP